MRELGQVKKVSEDYDIKRRRKGKGEARKERLGGAR